MGPVKLRVEVLLEHGRKAQYIWYVIWKFCQSLVTLAILAYSIQTI